MIAQFIKYVFIISLFTACSASKSIPLENGKTILPPKGFFSKHKDSIFLFEPIILIKTESSTPYHETVSYKRAYTKKFHNAIDRYFTLAGIQHQSIVGNFMDNDKINNLANVTNLVFDIRNVIDSLPLKRGFNLPKNKKALLIVHQLYFSSDFAFYDISSLPFNATNYQSSILEKVLEIKSFALLFKNDTLQYYKSYTDTFDENKFLKNPRKAIRVYHRILKKLLFR
jgi:hypothetical protein